MLQPSSQHLSPAEFCQLVRRPVQETLILNASPDQLTFMGPDIDIEALERIFVLGEASVSLATVLEKHKLGGGTFN